MYKATSCRFLDHLNMSLTKMSLLKYIDALLWFHFLRLHVVSSDGTTFEMEVRRVCSPKTKSSSSQSEEEQIIHRFTGNFETATVDIVNNLDKIGIPSVRNFAVKKRHTEFCQRHINTLAQHERNVNDFLKEEALEKRIKEKRFDKAGFTDKPGEGSHLRSQMWNVLANHEDKMKNFALIFEDYREDFVFCIDE